MRIPLWAFGSLAVFILVLAQEAVDADAATDTDASTGLLEADDQLDGELSLDVWLQTEV